MSLAKNDLKPILKVIYEKLLKDFQKTEGFELMVSHFGEFSQDLVNSLSEGSEYSMLNKGAKKSLTKRMFSVLIEGLQNLRLHGERDNSGRQIGHLLITEKKGTYYVSIGNVCKISSKEGLETLLEKLNAMSNQDVKDYYMMVLSNGIMSDKGGAGLGFITIKLKSQSKLIYSFEPLNDSLCYFSIHISLLP